MKNVENKSTDRISFTPVSKVWLFTALIFTKLKLDREPFVNNAYVEFNKNMTRCSHCY